MKALIQEEGRMNPSYIVKLPIGVPKVISIVYGYSEEEAEKRIDLVSLLKKIKVVDTTIPMYGDIDFIELNDLAGKIQSTSVDEDLVKLVMLDALEQGITTPRDVRVFAGYLGAAERVEDLATSKQVTDYIEDTINNSPNGISQVAYYLKELTQDDGDHDYYIEQDSSYITPVTGEQLFELVRDIITQFRENLKQQSDDNENLESPIYPLPDPHPVPSTEPDIPLHYFKEEYLR